jgi:hypothetical protein
MIKTLVTVAAVALVFLPAPDAKADPTCWINCDRHVYQGPLQPTWELPPYGSHGGSTVQCYPGTNTCTDIATDPNGRG